MNSCTQQVHQQARREGAPVLPADKKTDRFEWTPEAQEAFTKFKRTLSTPPILVAPMEKEPLYLYIAAMNRVVSTVLVVEHAEEGRSHGVQRPVYYLREVFVGNMPKRQ